MKCKRCGEISVTQEEKDCMEVKPKRDDTYYVTVFHYDTLVDGEPLYTREYMEFKNGEWVNPHEKSYVCFITAKAI